MIWQGSLKVYPKVMLGQDFAIRTVSTETVKSRVYLFAKANKFKIKKFGPECYIINELLPLLARAVLRSNGSRSFLYRPATT